MVPFWFSVKIKVKNWRKREDSALGGICKAWGLSIRCSWSPRGSWFFGLRPENSLSRPVREPDDGRGLVSGVSVSGISNADAPHQSRNPAGWRFVTSIRFPPVSFDPIHRETQAAGEIAAVGDRQNQRQLGGFVELGGQYNQDGTATATPH